MTENHIVLFDSIKKIKHIGEFSGSIISKTLDPQNCIIFSDSIKISDEEGILISEGLMVGFEEIFNEVVAFSRKDQYSWKNLEEFRLDEHSLEYSISVPEEIMQLYDEGQFSDAFPFTINMLHTAGLYLQHFSGSKIDHLNFFKGEILKNPVGILVNGICVADRVAIDHRADPVFYDTILIGRNKDDELKASYEPLLNVKIDDKVITSIVILGIENLKE